MNTIGRASTYISVSQQVIFINIWFKLWVTAVFSRLISAASYVKKTAFEFECSGVSLNWSFAELCSCGDTALYTEQKNSSNPRRVFFGASFSGQYSAHQKSDKEQIIASRCYSLLQYTKVRFVIISSGHKIYLINITGKLILLANFSWFSVQNVWKILCSSTLKCKSWCLKVSFLRKL